MPTAPRRLSKVVQGFGNVGFNTAFALSRHGTRIVATSDYTGGIYNEKGLHLDELADHVEKHKVIKGFKGGEAISNEELLTLKCDALVPAALERQITEKNVNKLKCRILAEAANGPTTIEADKVLRQSDIFLIPDVLCNSGGVIVSYFEWVQDLQNFFWTEPEVNDRLYRILEQTFSQVLQFAKTNKLYHRDAALAMGIKKVIEAKRVRGLFP
jgi:glutamate dehydrogenase (NAD(P)+)